MSQKEIKSLYESLLSNGDLLERFPELSGEWKKDKSKFTDQYLLDEEILRSSHIDLDDNDEDSYLDDQNLVF